MAAKVRQDVEMPVLHSELWGSIMLHLADPVDVFHAAASQAGAYRSLKDPLFVSSWILKHKKLPLIALSKLGTYPDGTVQAMVALGRGALSERNKVDAIHHAIVQGNHRLVRDIIAAGADLKDHDPEAPLLITATRKESLAIVDMLLLNGADVDARSYENSTALIEAASMEDYDVFARLLAAGADVNAVNDYDDSALTLAVSSNKPRFVAALLERNASLRAPAEKCWSPLTTACFSGYADVTLQLLKAGADPTEADDGGNHALLMAAGCGSTPILEELIATHPALVNLPNNSGNTPLMVAENGGHLAAARLLIDAGAHVNASNDLGTTAIIASARHRRRSDGGKTLTDMLLAAGASACDVNEAGNCALHVAANSGALAPLRALLRAAPEIVDTRDSYGRTPLMLAVRRRAIKCARALVRAGADVNSRADGSTILHQIAARIVDANSDTDVDMIQLLLAAGARLEDTCSRGFTALALAVRSGKASVVSAMVAAGASLDVLCPRAIESHARLPPLLTAIHMPYKPVVDALLAAGARVAPDDEAATAMLIESIEARRPWSVRSLLRAGVSPNCKDASGRPALILALLSSAFKSAAALLQAGADPEEGAPLVFAALQGHVDLVKDLLDRKANVNVFNHHGDTPLAVAAWKGHPEVVMLLVQRGADVSAVTKASKTTAMRLALQSKHWAVAKFLGSVAGVSQPDRDSALLTAAMHGRHGLAKSLLQSGANVDAVSTLGLSPLALAASGGHANVVRLLLQSGASMVPALMRPGLPRVQEARHPLVIAAAAGHLPVVRALARAFKNIVSCVVDLDTGLKPLVQAAAHRHHKVVSFLIGAGANVNAEDAAGSNALSVALRAPDNILTIKALLAARADVNRAARKEACPPLLIAAQEGAWEAVGLLLEAGADPLARSSHGATAICLAAKRGHTKCVQALLGVGRSAPAAAAIDPADSPVLAACAAGHVDTASALLRSGLYDEDAELAAALSSSIAFDVPKYLETFRAACGTVVDCSRLLLSVAGKAPADKVQALLDAGASVHLADSDGNTALLAACRAGSSDAAMVLLAARADARHKNEKGETALILAASSSSCRPADLVDALVRHGADLDALAADGSTALDRAGAANNAAAMHMLVASGAEIALAASLSFENLRYCRGLKEDYASGLSDVLDALLLSSLGVHGLRHPEVVPDADADQLKFDIDW